jgi:hypothetical protein
MEAAAGTLIRLFALRDPPWLEEAFGRAGLLPFVFPTFGRAMRRARSCGLPLLPAGLDCDSAGFLAWACADFKLAACLKALADGRGLELWTGLEPYWLAACRRHSFGFAERLRWDDDGGCFYEPLPELPRAVMAGDAVLMSFAAAPSMPPGYGVRRLKIQARRLGAGEALSRVESLDALDWRPLAAAGAEFGWTPRESRPLYMPARRERRPPEPHSVRVARSQGWDEE